MIAAMNDTPAGRLHVPPPLLRRVVPWLLGWWQIIHFGAVIGVMALSPAMAY